MKDNCKLNGFLVTYNSSKKSDITKINYYLFGRLVTIKKSGAMIDKYYYPGVFENTPFRKLTNGCYFVQEMTNDFNGLLRVFPSTIEFDSIDMVTARDSWKEKVNEKVHNW